MCANTPQRRYSTSVTHHCTPTTINTRTHLKRRDYTYKCALYNQWGAEISPPSASTRISFLSNSSTTYGSHHARLRCMLSRASRWLVESRPCGWSSSCFWITSGNGSPGGSDSPRPAPRIRQSASSHDGTCAPENMRIVSSPVLNAGSPLGGRGVVGRDGMGVVEREPMPFSLLSFPSANNDERGTAHRLDTYSWTSLVSMTWLRV